MKVPLWNRGLQCRQMKCISYEKHKSVLMLHIEIEERLRNLCARKSSETEKKSRKANHFLSRFILYRWARALTQNAMRMYFSLRGEPVWNVISATKKERVKDRATAFIACFLACLQRIYGKEKVSHIVGVFVRHWIHTVNSFFFCLFSNMIEVVCCARSKEVIYLFNVHI